MLNATRPQRTIAGEAEVRGVGFFLGLDVALRFRPAVADTGVVFVRVDLPGRPSVRACIENVRHTPRRTTIADGAASVELIEHVMAALAGLDIHNCLIEIDAPECPGLDGSSLAYVKALHAAGVHELDRPRHSLIVEEPVTVRDGHATLTALPAPARGPRYTLAYHLDYGPDSPIGSQGLSLGIDPESFAAELADCRTFLLESEADMLRKAGVGRRAGASDVLVFGKDGVVGNTLRHPDECVRHKVLDMVGDFALLERDIIGQVVAHRSGHNLNAALVRALLESSRTAHDGMTPGRSRAAI